MTALHSKLYSEALCDLSPETRRTLGDSIARFFQEVVASKSEDKITRLERATAYLHLGGVYFREGKLEKVVVAYERAVSILRALTTEYPLDTAHWQELGQAHYLLGLQLLSTGHTLRAARECREAAKAYRQAVRVGPSDPRALAFLAEFLSRCPIESIRAPGEALSLARRATELAPDYSGVWDTRGYAEYRAGNWRASISALRKWLEAASPDLGSTFNIYYLLAMDHWRLGEREEALKWFHQANEQMKEGGSLEERQHGIAAEAAALLGVMNDLPADVFAPP
jgi:tetratricopeptide (TPR) repeat protein